MFATSGSPASVDARPGRSTWPPLRGLLELRHVTGVTHQGLQQVVKDVGSGEEVSVDEYYLSCFGDE
jgi:hypothetical protein